MTRVLIGTALLAALPVTKDVPAASEAKVANPLLAPWTGPYGGVPPFDTIKVADFEPALEASMAEKLAAVERIAGSAAAPTFENTIAALERSGRAFDRVQAVFGVWSST